MNIISIDPGNEFSAYVLLDCNYYPIEHAKITNDELLTRISALSAEVVPVAVIEKIANMGMGAVGQTIFDTCNWSGRFHQALVMRGMKVEYIFRREEKINLCGSMKAKDGNIRQALIDRFGPVGVKACQGWFYGFKSDEWAAMAVGVTWLDKQKGVVA